MEHAFKFESPEDFNARESRKLNLINLETRQALISAATQTLFSAAVKEKNSVELFARQNASHNQPESKLLHWIEWDREKDEFISDNPVSCKLAERVTANGEAEGVTYEVLFPLKKYLNTAEFLVENFDDIVNEDEFYIIRSNTENPEDNKYFYINKTGIAEYEPCSVDTKEHEIELAFFIENKHNIPLPILTADREMRLYANLIEMKLVPYKISNL
jgi:hypothetical protein